MLRRRSCHTQVVIDCFPIGGCHALVKKPIAEKANHCSDEADLRDLLRGFEIVRLWADLKEIPPDAGGGLMGKWVVQVRNPLSG